METMNCMVEIPVGPWMSGSAQLIRRGGCFCCQIHAVPGSLEQHHCFPPPWMQEEEGRQGRTTPCEHGRRRRWQGRRTPHALEPEKMGRPEHTARTAPDKMGRPEDTVHSKWRNWGGRERCAWEVGTGRTGGGSGRRDAGAAAYGIGILVGDKTEVAQSSFICFLYFWKR